MPVRLSRPAIALTILLVAGLAAAVALVGVRDAKAQVQTQVTVFSNMQIVVSNGHFAFGEGSGEEFGTLGASCTGARPRSGTNIPVGVVTELTATNLRLRVLNQAGRAITGTVYVNCTFELVVESAAASRITSAFRDA